MPSGYMGTIIHVDLTSRQWHLREVDPDDALAYGGGMGLNARLMAGLHTPGADALSPENPIILGVGPLVGTNTPAAAKVVATTKFPLNGTISESVGSMRFARNLKGAGFDHAVVTGRAAKPLVLVLGRGSASLKEADDLWGRDVFVTTDHLKKSCGGPKSSAVVIGPSGENQVVSALALVDKSSTLGRGGLGAVMGSKNLKAVVAMGDARAPVADPKALKSILHGIRDRLKKFKGRGRVLELGLLENWDNYLKQLTGFRNFSEVFPREKATALYGPDVLKGLHRRAFGCPSCFMPDKEHLEVKAGKHKGFQTTTTAFFNSFLLGYLFDVNRPGDRTASLRLQDSVDRAGLDMFTFGAMLDFLVTQCEEGKMDPDRFGLPLRRDGETVAQWIEAVASREGFGDVLASGWSTLLAELGEGYRTDAPIIKDTEILWDPRLAGLGTLEFEQIVSLKGPRSASGGSPTYLPGQPEENLPIFERHLDRMGAPPDAVGRIMDSALGFNVGRMARYSEDWYTILSSLGICIRAFINRFYSYGLCTELFSAVTGFQVDEDHLRQVARRTWDTLKRLNQEEGFGPPDDRPPDMWFRLMKGEHGEPLAIRDYFGKTQLNREDVARLVADYYDERGWKEGRV